MHGRLVFRFTYNPVSNSLASHNKLVRFASETTLQRVQRVIEPTEGHCHTANHYEGLFGRAPAGAGSGTVARSHQTQLHGLLATGCLSVRKEGGKEVKLLRANVVLQKVEPLCWS